MTRKEQINLYLKERNIPIASLEANSIIEGIEWADEHPNKKLVYTKQELMDMGFSFDLNGNISTPQEIEERSKKYINYLKNKWIDKACNLLKNIMYIQTDYEEDMYGVGCTFNFLTNDFDSVDEFIEYFKKEIG